MDVFGQMFTIRVAHDWAVEALSLAALCGAVICAGVAGGVEAAGGVALLAARTRRAASRYRELRFDGGAWTAVSVEGITAIEPPIAHVAHRAVIVLEVSGAGRSGPGRSDFLVFSPTATPPDDLRRLRVRLRAEGLSR